MPSIFATKISDKYTSNERAIVYEGACLELLKTIPDGVLQLTVTSPPYNIGKEYENKLNLKTYLNQQAEVISECARTLSDHGSICWQVGNYMDNGGIVPLDIVLYPIFTKLGLTLRNRIIWHFEHGLHCSRRFSGRYETILWLTKSKDYIFNLDPVRVPQKYPGKKHFKGPKAGQYSCNPLGKNPGDLWVIPNVKSNHVEKTIHPCQFPVELVERLVLSLSNENDWVFDSFLGVGSTMIAALRHNRRAMGAEIVGQYADIARSRIADELKGILKTRPMFKPGQSHEGCETVIPAGTPESSAMEGGLPVAQAPDSSPRQPEACHPLRQAQDRLGRWIRHPAGMTARWPLGRASCDCPDVQAGLRSG
jgi:adenine-specific DNA-methyltransferase